MDINRIRNNYIGANFMIEDYNYRFKGEVVTVDELYMMIVVKEIVRDCPYAMDSFVKVGNKICYPLSNLPKMLKL